MAAVLRPSLTPDPIAAPAQSPADTHVVGPETMSQKSADNLPLPLPFHAHVDVSPTASNGTDNTDIDEEAQEGIDDHLRSNNENDTGASRDASGSTQPQCEDVLRPTSPNSLSRLDTAVSKEGDFGPDDAPTSVIHISEDFKHFANENKSPRSTTWRAAIKTNSRIASPSTPDAAKGPDDKRLSGQVPPPDLSVTSADTVNTNSRKLERQDSVADSASTASMSNQDSSLSSPIVSGNEQNIHVINVNGELAGSDTASDLSQVTEEVKGLRRALSNCWNLCNTLAELSSTHRHRVLSSNPRSRHSITAWKSCWKLCQQLYVNRHAPLADIEQSIELCREFTVARFECRSKGDATSDSILRVSFEMNTHLYNVRDRTLPPAFVKRSMDFHMAFCHRMLKQRSSLPQDTDDLLGACFALASSLYRLQQLHEPTTNEDQSEEEVLTGALHASFSLSNLLRESWTTSRASDRGTPRPRSITQQRFGSAGGRTSSQSNRTTYRDAPAAYNPSFSSASGAAPLPFLPPETPITIFDDVTDSDDSPLSAHQSPEILVLGPDQQTRDRRHHQQQQAARRQRTATAADMGVAWSSDSDVASSSSGAARENAHHLRTIKALLLRVALNLGFGTGQADGGGGGGGPGGGPGGQSVQHFARGLRPDALGDGAERRRLLNMYRTLLGREGSLDGLSLGRGERFEAWSVRAAVEWLVRQDGVGWGWMWGLVRFVGEEGVVF